MTARGHEPQIRYGTSTARWVLAATVLGSGIAFLDGTVVNVALPAIGADLGTSITGLQWTVDAYLVTLSALLLLGGTLGDRYGRRAVFVVGLAGFSVASLLCAAAPSFSWLVGARTAQGAAAALLVPGSLAIIGTTFDPRDRGRAVGAWSGLAGVTSAIGPFLGGWLIDAVSWRLIFLINVPIAAVAGAIAVRHVPETRAAREGRLDIAGAATATAALTGLAFAAIERHGTGSGIGFVVGVIAGIAFIVRERSAAEPMLPLDIFRSRQFTGANLTTLAVYGALGAGLFLVVLRLQESLGYSALEAGASLVPFTLLMLVLSPAAGGLGQRVGARLPMTIGPFVTAAGLVLFARVAPGTDYATGVLPAVIVFGLGMALTVAPLTAAVLGGVDEGSLGIASGVNNAVARFAGLLAIAVLPALTGISGADSIRAGIDRGYSRALLIAAWVCAAGGLAAFVMVRRTALTMTPVHPAPQAACHHPCVALDGTADQESPAA